MAKIVYQEGMRLLLRVKDSGALEGYTLYFDGELSDEIGDQEWHSYKITRPAGSSAVVIHFNGEEGGVSAVYDLANGGKRVDRQIGPDHSYIFASVGAATTVDLVRNDAMMTHAKSLEVLADAHADTRKTRGKK